MSDTITVTVQRENRAASAQTFDFNSDEALPLPPTGAGNTERDIGSVSLPPVVDEDDASTGELSASEVPSPPEFDENTQTGAEEGIDDENSLPPRPPEP